MNTKWDVRADEAEDRDTMPFENEGAYFDELRAILRIEHELQNEEIINSEDKSNE